MVGKPKAFSASVYLATGIRPISVRERRMLNQQITSTLDRIDATVELTHLRAIAIACEQLDARHPAVQYLIAKQ